MSFIKDIIIVAMFTAVCEILLPSGNMKKYASSIIALIMVLMVISPVITLIKGNTYINPVDIKNEREEYVTSLEQEVCDRTEKLIEQKAGEGVKAEVTATVSEDTRINRVILYGSPNAETMFYITDKLGVHRNDIEIRQGIIK